MGKILLLSVGINAYSAPLNQLNYCVADAKLIFDNYSQFGCQYEKLLLDEKATRSEILKSILEIKRTRRNDDYFIFSFAGHGCTIAETIEEINSKNSFICPYDFDYNYSEVNAISLYELNEIVQSLEVQSNLIIFDACHSGGALRKTLENLRDIEVSKLFEILANNYGTCIFTACDSHEYALESKELMHGFFTHSLIGSLKELRKQGDSVPFGDVYNLVNTKVKEATDNTQNPKVKCNNNDFTLLTLPETGTSTKKEIDIDTTIIPTPSFSKSYEYVSPKKMEDIEKVIIQLIRENRFIELDRLFKSFFDSAYTNISSPDISYSANSEEAINFYETCREYLKPLILISKYDIEYFESKCLMKNLEYIFELEELCQGKSGYTAIIEIPLVLETEFILQVITKAYETKDGKVLRKILGHKINSRGDGRTAPFIYDYSFWIPHIFNDNIDKFLKYLFKDEWIEATIFNKKFIEHMNEICFLFDCYSTTDNSFHSYPTYYTFKDFQTPDRVTSKLETGELNELISTVFSVDIKKFAQLAIDRLNYLKQNYTGYDYRFFSYIEVIKRLEKLKQ